MSGGSVLALITTPRAREQLLRAKNLVEVRLGANGYVSFKGNRHAFRSWVTGEWLLM